MYFNQILLAMLTFTSLVVSGTSSANSNTLCANNQLANFSVRYVVGYKNADYCQIEVDKVPVIIKNFIESLGDQHQKVAAQFGLTAQEAFQNNPLDFRLRGDELGPLSSVVTPSNNPVRLYLGVFADWNGEELTRAIYSHELGHVLSLSHNSLLPKAYLDLASTALVTETVADALSLQTEGSVMGDTKSPVSCMSRVRKIDSFQTYDFAEDFFTNDWWNRSLLSCCRQILVLNPDDRHWGQTCKNLILKAETSPPLDPVSRQKIFNPSDYTPYSRKFDPHQIGIPVNSFLKDLGEQNGRNAYALFIEAFKSASVEGLDYERLHCKIPRLETVIPALTVNQVSMGTVLNRLRELLSKDNIITYDKLWNKHGIEKAVSIGRADAIALAQDKQVEAFMTAFQSATKDPLLKKAIDASGCIAGDIGEKYLWMDTFHQNLAPTAGCGIICEK